MGVEDKTRRDGIDLGTRLRRVGHRLMNPHPAVAAVVVLVSGVLTALALATGHAESPWAIAVYPFACYGLALVVRGAMPVVRWVRSQVMGHELSRRYVTDMELRTRVEVHVSLVVDGLYGLFMLGSGVFSQSLWFGATGVYYLVLTLLHAELVRCLHRGGEASPAVCARLGAAPGCCWCSTWPIAAWWPRW